MTKRSPISSSPHALEESSVTAESAGGPSEDTDEMEAAAQLLEITNESELDQFIGRLLQKAARAAGSAIPSSILRPLGQSLKGALKHVLPIVGGPSGNTLASGGGNAAARTLAAADAFGLELEGLSQEDQEFELARRFVRLTRAAGRRAPRFARRGSPRTAVRRTLVTAARRYAPGLLRRRRRRRRPHAYRRIHYTRLAPIQYTDPEPILDPSPVVTAGPDPDPEPPTDPEPTAAPDVNGDAAADAGPGGDSDAAPTASNEPTGDNEMSPHGTCRCGGRCRQGKTRRSGSWIREGGQIILRNT